MIRPLSLLTGIAMAAAIGHTFEVKRSVTVLDRELRDIRRGTEEVEGRTQLLQAEWARLNDQERLRGLADRHLAGLSPMQSGQFQRLDEAVRAFRKALSITPDSEDAHTNLGIALGGLGRVREAEAEFRAALALNPSSSDARDNLALLERLLAARAPGTQRP
jgi:Flp pilus assembly protein TadD